ncbi:MAG: hypothetical protein PHQ35_09770 [Phycisphaerae bacterium]|nr:hypothetical protein [Phycisphaerae bacterium]MDD5239983.1 hypothetical protein [Candidatus Nanoarchaeia archaeon]
MENESVLMQFITFNVIEINGRKTFDNLFIALDAEDKIGAGNMFPIIQEVSADV